MLEEQVSRKSAMRRTPILVSCLLLAGCVNDTASYAIDSNQHALIVKVDQDYFWSDGVAVSVIATRLPDCQRMHRLEPESLTNFELDVYAAGDNNYIVRTAYQAWQVETETCERKLDAAAIEPGERLGGFKFVEKKLVFVPEQK